jgi:hypothetical protein
MRKKHLLVGGFNPSEKYESQLGLLFPYIWKVIKFMFQTTNQFKNHQPASARSSLIWSLLPSPIEQVPKFPRGVDMGTMGTMGMM